MPAARRPYAGVCFPGGGGFCSGEDSAREGGCLLGGGVCSQGVSAPGGVWSGGSAPGGGVCSQGRGFSLPMGGFSLPGDPPL